MSDLINRQDAIALVDRPIVPTGDAVYDNAREDERASIKDDLASLPSAEPKHGEWIYRITVPTVEVTTGVRKNDISGFI